MAHIKLLQILYCQVLDAIMCSPKVAQRCNGRVTRDMIDSGITWTDKHIQEGSPIEG